MRKLILGLVLISFAFTLPNLENQKPLKQLPIVISFYKVKQVVEDTLTDFTQVYLRSKKIEVISIETASALYDAELKSPQAMQIAKDDADRGEFSQNTYKKIREFIGPIANTVYFQLKADSITQTVDSIYWNVNYIPMNMEFKPIKHSFAPQNKSVYHALKEMCDSIIASKDVL